MSKVLVKFNNNYADEFDLDGWEVMTQSHWDSIVAAINRHTDWDVTWGFGTNEELEWSTAKDLLSCYTTTTIDEDDVQVLQRLFGGGGGEFARPWENWDAEIED